MFFSCGRYQMRDGLKSAFPSGVFGKKAGRSVRSGGPCVPAFERGRRRAGRRGERRTWASGEILRAVGKAYAGSCGMFRAFFVQERAKRFAVPLFSPAGRPALRRARDLFSGGKRFFAEQGLFEDTKKSRSLRNRPVQAYASPESSSGVGSASPSPR